jgi:signal peptidase I
MTLAARRPSTAAKQPSLLRTGVGAALFVAFIGLWVAFAPTQVGGSAMYVSTYGTSMEPMLHKGDLVLVRAESDYHVGQVVAYRSKSLNAVVLHRIIDRDGDRYVFKGDNNSFLDTDHPERSQLIGAMQMKMPGFGTKLQLLHTPAGMGLASAALVAPFFGLRRKRKGEPGLDVPQAPSRTPAVPARGESSLGSFTTFARTQRGRVLAGAVAGAVLLSGYAWTQPLRRTATSDVIIDEHGTFSYSADAPGAADVYADGRVNTGDPVYLNLVDRIDVGFDYDISSVSKLDVTGTGRLDFTVSDTTGWSRTLPLAAETALVDGKAHVGGTIDLAALRATIAAAEARTGVKHDSYTVSLRPVVQRTATLGKASSNEVFAPALDLQLDELVLALQNGSADKITPAKGGLLSATREVPSRVSLLMADLEVSALRRASLVLVLVGALVLIAEHSRFRRVTAGDDAAVATALGTPVIPVATVGTPDGNVCAVRTLHELVPMAQVFGLPILQLTDGSGSYVVLHGTTTYRYTPASPAAAPLRPRSHSQHDAHGRRRRTEPLRAPRD